MLQYKNFIGETHSNYLLKRSILWLVKLEKWKNKAEEYDKPL